MAKDTAETAPALTDEQLQAWIYKSPENLAAFEKGYTAQNTAPGTAAPGTAELGVLNDAKAEYKRLLAELQTIPPDELGSRDNDLERAVKAANQARLEAQGDYFSALKGTIDDPWRYNPRTPGSETSYFTDAEGNFGLGIRPENLYYNDYSGTMVEGQEGYGPEIVPGPGDLALGQYPEGYLGRPGQGGQDPFAPPPNYQQEGGNGLPNGGIPEGYLPDSSGNSYWDYITNGGTVPNVPGWGGSYVQNGPQQSYNSLTNSNLGQGDGAVTGPAAGPAAPTNPNWVEELGGPLQGYESSSNKDYYQRQFQEMNAAQRGQKNNDFAAAIRREQAAQEPQGEPFGGDPWSWANLPQVQMGTGERTGTTEWQLNPRFDWSPGTTNQQVVQDLNLTADELSYLTKNPKKWEAAPSVLDQSAFQQFINSSPGDRGYTDTLNKIYQAAWRPTISGEGGPLAPVGYAAPINVQGAA